MNIIYMGTPDFAVPALKKLYESKHTVQAVLIFNIGFGEVEIFDVVNYLLKTCRNGKTAVVGHFAKEKVEVNSLFIKAVFKIAV